MHGRVYYPVWISDGRKDNPISWGKPCNLLGQALRLLKDRLASGGASMGVIIKFAEGKKQALEPHILPRSARVAIRHYLDILDSLQEGNATEPEPPSEPVTDAQRL